MKNRKAILKTVLSGLFMALAMLLPFVTGQLEQLGQMLCPMHIPVLLCGFVCGPAWGAAVGVAAPLLRSAWLGMPPMFPKAVSMALELATYGAVSGLLWRLPLWNGRKKWTRTAGLYASLVAAMLAGRLAYGAVMAALTAAAGGEYSLGAWYATAITEAIPGIILQLVLIPAVVRALFWKKSDTKKPN